ncbi:MAG: hypothetical protein ACXVRU_08425 [Gaiellaceae bacterium]
MRVEFVRLDNAWKLGDRCLRIANPEFEAKRRKAKAKLARAGKSSRYTFEGGGVPEFGTLGTLGLTELNREMNYTRAEMYAEEMRAGRWQFSPDPIVVTAGGMVVNGQHRLAAAGYVTDWSAYGGDIPEFLVVWGVSDETALLTDEAQRSTKDRRHIALSYARASRAV